MIGRCMFLVMCITMLGHGQSVWLETTQSDFADGYHERNLYASNLNGGAIEFVPRFDLNNDGYIDLFTADRYGPYVRIYWGSATGYSAGNVTLFTSSGGANCDAADLNGDGFPDFLVAHYFEKLSIYWGSSTGPSPANHQDFPMGAYNRQGVYIADFNKDGYLDITTTQEFTPNNGAVLWGSSTGYSINDRTNLPCTFGIHNIEVADINKDNWLDILYVVYIGDYQGLILVYWGSNAGFVSTSFLPLWGPLGNTGVSVADLNDDGYIDIVTTGWYDTQSYIYWGSASGFSTSQILDPGYSYGGSAVADLNNDTYLDILYHRGGYGTACQRVYWGSTSGYSNSNYSDIGVPLETTGGLIADFNADGYLDIFSNTRTPENYSYIFLGPAYIANTYLPVEQDHHGMFREIGNVYNRKYYEDYLSSVLDAVGSGAADWGIVEWDASIPTGSAVLFWVRSGDTPVPDASWADWFSIVSGDSIPDNLNAQYLQYKARLSYDSPADLPLLYEVSVTYTGTGIANEQEGVCLNGGVVASVNCRPNPFKRQATIFITAVEDKDVTVNIFDVSGKLLRSFASVSCQEGCASFVWDRNDSSGHKVPAGIYLYRVEGFHTHITGKAVVLD